MARKEKISEARKQLIQSFIDDDSIKTANDVHDALKDLFKDALQEMLNAELTEHLGYEKNEYTKDNENYRNGYSQKTVHSTEGDITLDVPRDRQGTFEPIVVEKGQKDISSIEEKIIRMRPGMTQVLRGMTLEWEPGMTLGQVPDLTRGRPDLISHTMGTKAR